MQKFIAFLSIGLMVASTASAEVDAQAFKAVSDIQRGVDNNNQIKTLRVAGDASIGDDMTLGGDLTVSGAAQVIGQLESGPFFAPSAQLADGLNVGTNVIVGGSASIGGDLALNGSRIAITSNLVAVAGAVTATMTNAPALVSAAAPKWVVVEIDGTDYAVPAFELQP